MELVSGGALQERVHARGQLPIGEAVDCVLQIIEVLAAAQRIGILHRDVKLSNCSASWSSLYVRGLEPGRSGVHGGDPRAGQALDLATLAGPGVAWPARRVVDRLTGARLAGSPCRHLAGAALRPAAVEFNLAVRFAWAIVRQQLKLCPRNPMLCLVVPS